MLRVRYGNTTNEAKNDFSLKYEKNGYEFYDQDLNEGTGGKFIYMAIKRGVSSRGVQDIGVRFQDGTPPDSGGPVSEALPTYTDFNILNSTSEARKCKYGLR